MADERQEVILLTSSDISSSDISSTDIETNVASSCSSVASTTSALTKLITASNSGSNPGNTFILYIPSFRKIEPKPELELKACGEDEEKELLDKDAKSSAGRFLAINATKRGVKTCQGCFKKIGYRAKQCKYCSPSKHRSRRPRLQNIKPSIKPISSKTAQLIAEHIGCDNSVPIVNDSECNVTQQDCPERLDDNLLSSNLGNEQLDTPMISQTQEQMQTIVSPLEDSSNHEYNTTVVDCNAQSLDTPKRQEAQLLGEATQVTTQEDQQQLDAAVDNLLNQPEKMVLDSDLVSNVTEVASSGEVATTSDCTESQEPDPSNNHDEVNTVFVSSKVSQNIDSQGLTSNSGRYSLQDLICGLLAQNQGVSISQNDPKEVNTSVVGLNAESVDSETCKSRNSRSGLASNMSPKEKTGESSYDANSVALFLGEMAQRNNGKKRKISPLKPHDGDSKVIAALIPGTNQKCILMTSSEQKAGKFRKIQPKDIGSGQDEINTCDEDKEASRDYSADVKEQQSRIMNGNATRRGVMLCIKCNKMIGCRSKVCKHCKHPVTESITRQGPSKLIKQAVKLLLPADLGVEIYSVRKCKTGPELRCFVQFDSKNSTSKSAKYICDYPVCVTTKELEDKTSNYICEHAKYCFFPVLQAKVPVLDLEKLATLNITGDMKESVQKLYSDSQSKGVPLVQYVSSRTLAIVEQINSTSNDTLGTGAVSFAHVRFENIKGQGCFQQQVHCSGRSCMTWNFLSSDPSTRAVKPYSCVHYAIALWAVASDLLLQKDLGEFLDAFVSQAKQEHAS